MQIERPSDVKVGDLVILKGRPLEAFPLLAGAPGIITDILEDDYGMCYFEVDFVDERGWFKSHEIQPAGAIIGLA